MRDQSDKKDENKLNQTSVNSKSIPVDKSKFGGLAPLTAAQVVALLIKSDIALGACACGGGPCY